MTENKKRTTQILVLLGIALAIVAVWFFKNNESTKAQTLPAAQISTPANPAVAPKNEGDFALLANAIDLDALTANNLPIIIDFGADSCEPCKAMAPVLLKLNAELQGVAIIKFVDVWKNPDASKGFPVQVIPTQFFILADGSPYVPSEDIGIDFGMYNMRETGEHVFTVHQGGLTEEQMRRILADMGAAV